MKSFLLYSTLLLLLVGCKKKSDPVALGACGNGDLVDSRFDEKPFAPFRIYQGGAYISGDTITYQVVGGKAWFILLYNQGSVCTEEHVDADYSCTFADVPQTLPMRVFGEVYIQAFGSPRVVEIFNGIPEPNSRKAGELNDIGLKQAFPEGPGALDMYLTIEFDTQGSYTADSAYFTDHVKYMQIDFYGSYH